VQHIRVERKRYFDPEASVLGIIYTSVYKRDRVSVGAPAVYTNRIAIRPCDTSIRFAV